MSKSSPETPPGGGTTETPRPSPWILRAIMTITGPWNRRNLISWVVLLGSIFTFKGCIIDQYTIPSGSMEPTLHGDSFFKGDRVLVNKWEMGPRIPFTTIRLWDWAAPKRWDIVVFRPVKGSSEHSILVKRVVGLPGERVRIVHGHIEINGEAVPFPPGMPKDMYYVNDEDLLIQMSLAEKPEVREAFRQMRERYPLRYGCVDSEQYTQVPEGHYLVLGDNSINSVDGRIWGWLPRNHIFGRTFAVWWPWSRRRDFSGFSHTWWGRLLLYGIPVALILLEARHQWLEHRERKKETAA